MTSAEPTTYKGWVRSIPLTKRTPRTITYFGAAVAVFALELSIWLAGEYRSDYSILIAGLMIGTLIAGGRYGFAFEIVYLSEFIICAVTPVGNDFSFLIFGIYIIAVSWVVHGWILPAFAIYITAEIALAYSAAVFSSASLAEQLISAVTGAIIVFGLGFWLRAEHAKNTRYAEEAQKAHEEAAAASAHVRRELATLLHDTVAKDLVRITLSAQNLADKHTDLQSELQDLAEIASQASQRVRPVILDMRQPPAASAHLASTIELAQRMLNTREITLEVEMPDNLDSELSDQQKALLRLLISEGVTNILKYAPVGACASMLISVGEQSAVSATLSNPIADNPEPSIIGGFGLQNLEFHFKESGGMVQYMRFKNRWLLYGEIPAQEER